MCPSILYRVRNAQDIENSLKMNPVYLHHDEQHRAIDYMVGDAMLTNTTQTRQNMNPKHVPVRFKQYLVNCQFPEKSVVLTRFSFLTFFFFVSVNEVKNTKRLAAETSADECNQRQ